MSYFSSSALPPSLLAQRRIIVSVASGWNCVQKLRCSRHACGPTLLVNVELKAAGVPARGLARLADRVGEVVERAGAGGRVLVSSFSPLAVRLWQRRAPAVPAALLFERDAPLPLRRGWLAAWLRPFAMHPEAVLCGPRRVAGWQAPAEH